MMIGQYGAYNWTVQRDDLDIPHGKLQDKPTVESAAERLRIT
jgi:hypothetical protein